MRLGGDLRGEHGGARAEGEGEGWRRRRRRAMYYKMPVKDSCRTVRLLFPSAGANIAPLSPQPLFSHLLSSLSPAGRKLNNTMGLVHNINLGVRSLQLWFTDRLNIDVGKWLIVDYYG